MIRRFLADVFDIQDLSPLLRRAAARPGGPAALPWCNWFFAPREVLRQLGQLHALFYSWVERSCPVRLNQCAAAPPGVFADTSRCWGYAGELLTVVFLTNEVPLYWLDDQATPTQQVAPFHAGGRPPGGGVLRALVGAAWARMSTRAAALELEPLGLEPLGLGLDSAGSGPLL